MIYLIGMGIYLHAGLMDGVENLIKSTLSDEEEVKTVHTIVTLKTTFPSDVNKHETEEGALELMTTKLLGRKKKTEKQLFDGDILEEVSDMISLEKGEHFGLPSIFGLNKKKEKKVFGSTILANTVLGDAKDMSTSIYRGAKYTGESTEFMSGIMYKSAKVYNGMFEIFDHSPLNIFDDKEERDASIFDVIDKGNTLLESMD